MLLCSWPRRCAKGGRFCTHVGGLNWRALRSMIVRWSHINKTTGLDVLRVPVVLVGPTEEPARPNTPHSTQRLTRDKSRVNFCSRSHKPKLLSWRPFGDRRGGLVSLVVVVAAGRWRRRRHWSWISLVARRRAAAPPLQRGATVRCRAGAQTRRPRTPLTQVKLASTRSRMMRWTPRRRPMPRSQREARHQDAQVLQGARPAPVVHG